MDMLRITNLNTSIKTLMNILFILIGIIVFACIIILAIFRLTDSKHHIDNGVIKEKYIPILSTEDIQKDIQNQATQDHNQVLQSKQNFNKKEDDNTQKNIQKNIQIVSQDQNTSNQAITMPSDFSDKNNNILIKNTQSNNILNDNTPVLNTASDKASNDTYLTANVTILVANLGLNESVFNLALTLPNYITLGFTPYADDLRNLIQKASVKGFDVLVNLPLQMAEQQNSNSGPYALSHNLMDQDNMMRLKTVLSKAEMSNGLYLNEFETFTTLSSSECMENVLSLISQYHLRLLYSPSSNSINIDNVIHARNINIRTSKIDLVLDASLSKNYIISQLDNLVKTARLNGKAIGIMKSYKLSIETLKTWLENQHINDVKFIRITNAMPYE